VSIEALSWALRDAEEVPAHCVGVLVGLANHASADGRGAYPSQRLLASYARKTTRQVRSDLRKLEEIGLIRAGDQRLVEHIPADRRPQVWDLALDRMGRAEAHFPPSGSGRKPTFAPSGSPRPAAGGSGLPPNRPTEPSTTVSHARAREATRWLHTRYGLTDDEAAQVIDQVKARAASPVAHLVPYMDRMTEGHLADIVAAVTGPTTAEPSLKVVPDWCGTCNEETRQAGDPDRPRRCPNCHPLRDEEAS
jgi:helix-turn-helix protein